MTQFATTSQPSRRPARLGALSGICLMLTGSALAGGEMAAAYQNAPPPRVSPAAELRAHYASRQAALASTFERTAEITNWVASRNTRRTAIRVPSKDIYGDPIYVAYGKRAYAGTPAYTGPAYVSSFGRDLQIDYEILYGAASRYWPGAQADPGYAPRTDVTLGMTAGQNYMQHGMQLTPGSLAPSYSRPILLNATLD